VKQVVEILLPNALNHGFDYVAAQPLPLGAIVSVPFGKGETLGVVWGEGKANLPPGKLKPINIHHDQFPPLSEAFRSFISWAAWYNAAASGAILKMVLPISEIDKTGRVQLHTAVDISQLQLAPLSQAQEQAAQHMNNGIGKGFAVTLLDGVTGSGKTEVYFDTIAHALKKDPGNQVLVLLPEIGLSVQFLARFEKRFGFAPVVWHSEITPAKKRASWQAIARGEARVVVGARSALFLPYKQLSLIVVDEEHDASYKQEDGIIYHARDMAVARGRMEKLPVVLVSATPSLESYHNARQQRYHELSLPVRHNEASMPTIHMIDMRKALIEKQSFISRPLREQLANAIAKGQQTMLFLNRRGYAPLMLCRVCGHRFQCPDCSAWLVLHKSRPRLECHHCNYFIPVPSACPSCGAEDSLHACGPGVERLFDEVKEFLPTARVAVMASDSMTSYRELQDTIDAMGRGEVDVLIGTQMMAKGHHFAGLAVVGVVDADLGLAGGDLRAAERTYQLLHQLSGRAGREVVQGHVFLQSFLPEHPVMAALLSGDREAFMQAELTARQHAHMPPFSRLAAIIIEGEKEDSVAKTARAFAGSPVVVGSKQVELYGPAPAPLFMLRGKFRYRLLLKAGRNVNLQALLAQWMEAVKPPSSVRVKLDIDPQSFL
jgi:primosomal protein N' (replication factor Y) (superfamily II helicase)